MSDAGRTRQQLERDVAQLRRQVAKLTLPETAAGGMPDWLQAEDMPVLACRFRPGGVITYANEAYCKYFDKRSEELVGSSFLALIPEEDREATMAGISALTVESPTQSHEHRVIAADGEIRWQRWTNRALFDDKGKVVAYQSIGEDITDRRRARQSIEEWRNRYQAAVDASGQILYDWHSTMGEVVYGGSLEKILGYTHEDMAGGLGRWLELIHPDDRPGFDALIERVLKTGGPVRGVYCVQKKNGEYACLEGAGQSTFDGEGNLVRMVGFLRDITEHKQTEERLQAEQAFANMIIQSMPGLFYIFEESSARFVRRNANWAKVTGHSEDELDTMTALDMMVDRELCARRMQEVYDCGSSSMENLLLTKAGEQIPYYFTGERIVLDGKAHLVGMGVDITDRKRAEEERLSLERQVQHAQKLKSLGVLAGGIAHDFNNILTGILGYAELALAELSSQAPARDDIQKIRQGARRAAELAKQMLAYSGKGRFVVEAIDLGELVEEMAHLLEVSISKKAVLKYNFADNLPTIDGDATQIRQIIMNLITNASEAIGETGVVVAISTGAMDCDRAYLGGVNDILRAGLDEPLPEGPYVFLEVADTGTGMDKATIAKVFDPFFTTKFTGRGLGMAAVLGIVRGHRGTIKICSEVGKGTTFKILFPASELPDSGTAIRRRDVGEGDADAEQWHGQGTVLIADDEKTVHAVGKRMLNEMGFSVLTASDGHEAVEIFRRHADEIDCILLDLTMPHMDGEEAFRELRRIRSDVAVILCSGYNQQDATQHFVGKGLAGFIQKPYSMATLKGTLMDVLPNDTA